MRAIILSAGRGRRLPKHLSLKPKVLLKIGNKTILEKQIKNGLSEGEIRLTWQEGLKKFKKLRSKYLIYN